MISDSLINIENLVITTFENALKNGDIIFQGFQITEQFIDGCSYQIRYVPGLEKKPVRDDVEKIGKDFLSPPYGNLHVCDISNYGLNQTTYVVLLNKYPLTKNHFLLLPHDFAKQSDVLSSDDLTLIYEILQNHKTTKLIAFFNCGEESGASQKHKHIQFYPVEDNEPPIDTYLQDENQYEQANQLRQVPWAHFVISLLHIPEQLDQLGNYLMNKFIQLLDKMFHFKQGKHFDGAKSSYNVLITKKCIHLIPRSKEIFLLSNHSRKSVGGTDYAGIMNIKEENDINTILNIGFTNILLDVGRKKD
ncbi:unnamed protein product [Adineta steineri]|uniref:ATP adenylyltransferase n=1 Tax=Adineta steineri TaxID=433720 RepID=A0A815Z117_9BILA|nr:unnamed protein product [Adineta steineri]CAF1304740.1 unnamed protein product [Adineta steineri]CAF1458261.1 unnamed protein product [Adineta steineri]CAF1577263.1 unnamed protein product [Adineta steineri]CAF1577344.1 unnamed protein product [Adineta steineri]